MMELTDNDETNQDLTIITEKRKENYRNRISMVILDKFTPAVKVVFDKEIHPDILGKMVNKNLEKLHELFERKILTPKQWDRLRPKKGSMPVSSNTFDGTLMICLLRHLLDEKISDRLPLPTDVSRNADLSRLLHYRNMIFHLDDQFDYSNSDAELDDCIQAIQRLSGMDCNDYKTKLFGDCSKDFRVVIEALLFLYSEGCNLERIGLSCAFLELTHIEQMGELLCLCVHYQLLEPVIVTLWKDLTEGKRFDFNMQLFSQMLNDDITEKVPNCDLLPLESETDEFRDEERRNSYLLYLAAMKIKICTFKNRKSKSENINIYEIPQTEPLFMYDENDDSFSLPTVFGFKRKTTGTNSEVESPHYTAVGNALQSKQNETEIVSKSSNASECLSFYPNDNNTRLSSQPSDHYSLPDEHKISAASSTYLGDKESIFESAISCPSDASSSAFRQFQLPAWENSSQSLCATEDNSSFVDLSNNETYQNNNTSNITDSASNPRHDTSSYSIGDFGASFFSSYPPSGVRNESGWNNNLSNGTGSAFSTQNRSSSYSFYDLLDSFSFSELLHVPDASDYSYRYNDTENGSYSSVFNTYESGWNNTSRNGTNSTFNTGFGNGAQSYPDTGYCTIL